MINRANLDPLNPVAQMAVPINLGTVSATAGDVAAFQLPFTARLKRIDLYCSAVTGTTPTLAVTATGTISGALGTTSNLTAAGHANLVTSEFDVATARGETIYLGVTAGGGTPDFSGVQAVLWFNLADTRDVAGTVQGTSY